MRKSWSWCVLSASCLGLLLTANGAGAKVLDYGVAIEVDARGKVSERWHVRVLIETVGDAADWQAYPIYLDDNRRLSGLDGWVSSPGGGRKKIGRKEQDLAQAAGEGVLHSSARYQVVEPPGLAPGATFDLTYSLEGEPYWPGGVLPAVLTGEEIENLDLSVRVDPAAGALHYRLDGPSEGLELEGSDQKVRLYGSRAKSVRLPGLAGRGTVREPVLRWSWGEAPSWEKIGGWYTGLLGSVPRGAPEVQKLANELVAGAQTPREKLEALVAHVRRKVRYVAVEVGIGGYRPHPPAEVANKLWGDCKDKSFLLIDLARAVGLEAWPVLIRFDESQRIDRDFPSPFQFNHAIAAFAAAPLEPKPGDPIAEGYFFIDPTQEIGAAGYLHQGVQDQDALVVHEGQSKLVRLPTLPETASRKLLVELKLAEDGAAQGRARLEIEGDGAASLQQFLDAAASQSPLESSLRKVFAAALAGASLEGLTYRAETAALPRFVAEIEVSHPHYVEGLERGGSLQTGGLRLFPENRDLEQIEELRAAATGSGKLDQTWIFELPAGFCAPKERQEKTENELGLVQTTLSGEGQKAKLERRAELRRSWTLRADYSALEELIIAESRTLQRRIRFACKDDKVAPE